MEYLDFAGRRVSSQQCEKRYKYSNCQEELRQLFEKKFRFEHPKTRWVLPDPSTLFATPPWSVESLQIEKNRLNSIKSQLNDVRIEEWSRHTRRRNPAGEVSWVLRRDVDPELLTQAWIKFYECAFQYDIVPLNARVQGRLVSLHLCEAPGAFVTALNHYLRIHHPHIQWEWTASTLNPYYEGNSHSNMISDDRFVWHTLPRWCFGRDHTGDITCWENSQSIVRNATSHSQVDLVTADGSIDCFERPDAQEELTSPLHYCEVVTALQALATGGTFICKFFTLFEHSTLNLLYLLNTVFEEVNMYKPATSKAGNSEVYAICLQYTGIDKIMPYMDALKAGFGTKLYGEKSLFPLVSLPEHFIHQVLYCAQFFCYMQCDTINSNLEAYLQNNLNCQEVKRLRILVSAYFMRFYRIRPIAHDEEILRGLMHEPQKVNTNPRSQRGSYTQRRNFDNLSAVEKFMTLEQDLSQQEHVALQENTISWHEFYDENFEIDLQFVHGKCFKTVESSKFIITPVLNQYRRLIEESHLKECPIEAEFELSAEDILRKYEIDLNNWKMLELPDVNIYDYGCYNKKCLELIINSLENLLEGDMLFLRNFDVLSHTSVGILHTLCRACFRSVGFTDGNGLALRHFVDNGKLKSLREVLKEFECSEGNGKSVLRILPVSITNEGDFYNTVICYNNSVYTKKSLLILSKMRRQVIGEIN